MTLTSSASSDVIERSKQSRLNALKIDLARTLKECGPSFLTPHPTRGERIFVIAADNIELPKYLCFKRGKMQRSALREKLTEEELSELRVELSQHGKYHIKLHEKDVGGSWISYRIEYFAGDEWS
ncbi:MAG: hypothetical protein EOT05_00575 [Candidatus Microsaccharimonas sossegonensis]|uniref:Uncharacterized protein n=1 Tax=Candidatus Microsaccharimonas sossegonensis TaxID=2506948 RepID=A0A4Q0AI22_9BACT|nr:MAG: hypothetical protein EOT05_00575 [Candidatus Microsaccharimonas sossegonensis]